MMYTDVKIAWKVKLFFQRARNGYNYLKKKNRSYSQTKLQKSYENANI